jgi:hypothetical protein
VNIIADENVAIIINAKVTGDIKSPGVKESDNEGKGNSVW